MVDWAVYQEAEKRGILPEDKKALFEEAKRRGLVPGYQQETTQPAEFKLEQAPPDTFFGKLSDMLFREQPEKLRAKAANSMYYASEFNISPSKAYELHDEISKQLGGKQMPTTMDMATLAIAGPVVYGLMTHPATTLLGIAAFEGLAEAESAAISLIQDKNYQVFQKRGLVDLLPEDVNKTTELAVETFDFLAKGIAIGAGHRYYTMRKNAVDKIMDTYDTPKLVIDKAELKDVALDQPTKAYLNRGKEIQEGVLEFNPKDGVMPDALKTFAKIDSMQPNRVTGEKVAVPTTKPKNIDNNVGKEVKKVAEQAVKMADEYLGSISTRLKNINPEISNALRKFEFDSGMKKQNTTKQILPVAETAKKMSPQDRLEFDLARKNSDQVKIDEISAKYGIENEVGKIREVLDGLYQEAKEVGLDIPYRENYYPRVLKDHEGFLTHTRKLKEWPIFQKAIAEQEVKLGRYLEAEEKAILINQLIQGLRGKGLKQAKGRKIQTVTEDLNQFYMDSDAAMIKYINEVSDAISAKRFFGVSRKAVQEDNIENSIGSYINRLMEHGKIDPNKEQVLKDILSARFNEIGTSGIVGLYKNLSYIDTMGSPISAVTQIGDVAWALYKTGLKQTTKATAKAIRGKSQIKKEDIGIERIAAEFSDQTKSAKAIEWVFKKTGLTKLDNIGKEALINSEYGRIIKLAKTKKGQAKLRKELEPTFGKETEALISDLKSETISENVKLHLFNTVADFQPIALTEMPQKYLTGGNGRLFYMLKTFTLKQFDIYRREVFQQINNP